MHREQIKELALANGFKLKTQPDGTEDLNPYVYEFARAVNEHLQRQNEYLSALASGQPLYGMEEKIADLMARNKALREEVERLRGITPELPPYPPTGEGLPRYGVRWNGPTQPLAVPMEDGYWAPWHLADELVQECQRLRTANLDSVAVCEQALQAKTTAEQERDRLKATVSLAIDTFRRYEMDVETYPTINHIKMMRNLNGALAKHDAEVIERETQRCIEAVEAEPEYPDEAPPELMKYINQCIENKDADHMLHMMRHSVRLTKSEIINRIRGLETQQAKEVQS